MRSTTFDNYPATRKGLIQHSIKRTRKLTKPFQTFSDASLLAPSVGAEFRYANYAIGGACGFKPASHDKRLALSTLDDEIYYFERDYTEIKHKLGKNENFLFIIWFGANDIYTSKRPAVQMVEVAEHITGPCRQKILSIVGRGNARFVYVNLGLPLSANRFANKKLASTENYNIDVLNNLAPDDKFEVSTFSSFSNFYNRTIGGGVLDFKNVSVGTPINVRKIINNLESGALLFNNNNELRERTNHNGDLYVNMCDVIKPETMQKLSRDLKVQEGYQPKGSLKFFYTPLTYRERFTVQPSPLEYTTLEDDVHPIDHIYGLMCTVIKLYFKKADITFGLLDNGDFNISAVTRKFDEEGVLYKIVYDNQYKNHQNS